MSSLDLLPPPIRRCQSEGANTSSFDLFRPVPQLHVHRVARLCKPLAARTALTAREDGIASFLEFMYLNITFLFYFCL